MGLMQKFMLDVAFAEFIKVVVSKSRLDRSSFTYLLYPSIPVIIQKLFLLQEKKTSLSRTASIENALDSIDNAFDFLADHQTMKPDTLLDEGRKEILPRKWNIFKFVSSCEIYFIKKDP